MATFAISLSVEIEADNIDQAYEIRDSLFQFVQGQEDVTDGPFEIDVEQIDGFEDEEMDNE
jgi:hypothetical protein